MSLSFCGYCYFATLNIFFALSLYFSFIIMCFFEAFVRSIHVLCPGCITLQKKMKFSIEDFFSKCDQIRRNLWIWSHLLKKSLKENFIFCTVYFIFLGCAYRCTYVKLSKHYFRVKTKISVDFYICISVPLVLQSIRANAILNEFQ